MARPVDVIVRPDDGTWAAWSPQCPGLAIVQPSSAELRDQLLGILWAYLGPGPDLDVRMHLEDEVRGVVVRVAQDHQRWERQLTADRIAAALGDPRQAREILAQAQNSFGEVVFVCATPGDTVDWIARQLDGDDDAVTVVAPTAGDHVWVRHFAGTRGRSDQPLSEPGSTRETTLASMMKAETAPRHMPV